MLFMHCADYIKIFITVDDIIAIERVLRARLIKHFIWGYLISHNKASIFWSFIDWLLYFLSLYACLWEHIHA